MIKYDKRTEAKKKSAPKKKKVEVSEEPVE
jgi:hypothetical protein